jgi:hypothetical protein
VNFRAVLQEIISKLAYTVTPAKAEVQNPTEKLDSGFRRNDDQRRLRHFEMVSKSWLLARCASVPLCPGPSARKGGCDYTDK